MGRIQTARLDNLIRRWGSIKGPGSLLTETLGDVFPVLDLENLTPENQLTAGWETFWIHGAVAGVVAQTSGVSLINPAGSGSLVVVDTVFLRSEFNSVLTIGSSLPLFTQIIVRVAKRDTRGQPFTGKAALGGNTNVGAIENGLSLSLVAGVDRQVEIPGSLAVLEPGTQLATVLTFADSNLTASFSGRVRLAEPSELSV